MLPADSILHHLSTMPLHISIMLAMLVASALACLGVVAGGAAVSRLRALVRRAKGLPAPPAAPGSFPFMGDQLYTAAFMLFLLGSAAWSLFPSAPGRAAAAAFGWSAFITGIAAQTGIYLPMLLRYGALHRLQAPTRPLWHYITLPLAVWAGIYLSIVLLELSGFTPWLIRATNCPEHQDLVLVFSRGEMVQRLYIIICAVLIAPVVEECCFRGFLYTTLRRHGGPLAAALASSLLFGAIHGSLAQMVPLMLFGIAQCFAYEKARSLWLPITVHMLFNTTSLIATAVTLP